MAWHLRPLVKSENNWSFLFISDLYIGHWNHAKIKVFLSCTLKTVWLNALKICKNVTKYDANELVKFHFNQLESLCDIMILNLWLILDSSALWQNNQKNYFNLREPVWLQAFQGKTRKGRRKGCARKNSMNDSLMLEWCNFGLAGH